MKPPDLAAVTSKKGFAFRSFLIFVTVVAIILGILSYALAIFLKQDALMLYTQVLFFFGLAYIFASALAWTGFANLYRYSPTLLVGSRSYRRTVVHGDLYWEGRDQESLLIGSIFGLALMGLSALTALFSAEGVPWFFAFAILSIGLLAVLLAYVVIRRRRDAVALSRR
jgi:hypothetical protein